MASNNNKAFEIQNQIRFNAEQMRESFVGLKQWETEMKNKEQTMREHQEQSSQDIPPVRSDVSKFQKFHNDAIRKIESVTIDDDNKTLEEFNDAAERKKEANSFKEKGNTLVKNKEFESAIKMYSRAIELVNDDPVFYSNRSQCFLKLEKLQECIDDAKMATELDPNHAKSYYRLMIAYEQMEENFKAIQACRKLLELTPDDELCKKSYDRIHDKIMEAEKKKDREKIRWSRLSPKAQYINFIEKSPHLRSKKPLKRIPVKLRKAPSPIPESIIDKIFNNNTGEQHSEPETDSKLFKSNFLQQSLITPKPVKSEMVIIEDKKKVDESNEILKATENKKDQIASLQELEAMKCSLITIPGTGLQFYAAWKELNEQQRFLYLKNIAEHDVHIGKLLGAYLDSYMLSEIILIVHKYFIHFNIPSIRLLKDLSQNHEISLLAVFLENDEKKKLNDLLALSSCGDNTTNNEIHEVKQKFQI